MRRNTRKNKNILAAIVFMLIIAFLVVGTTIAWLTKTSSITNTFTVGSFNIPTTFPDDPTDPESATHAISITGNLNEPSWNPDIEHKLMPAVSFAKDPYVGIGKGSEDAVVYVNVANNISSNKVYFTINDEWEPVAGHTTAGAGTNSYKSGVFKYTAGLTASASEDVWTTAPLFNSVTVADDANGDDFNIQGTGSPKIVVTCFLHQANNNQGAPISSTEIENAAITEFNKLNNN